MDEAKGSDIELFGDEPDIPTVDAADMPAPSPTVGPTVELTRAVSVSTETAGHKISVVTQGDSDFPRFKDSGKRSGGFRMLEAILEIIPHGLIIVSDDDRLVAWNRRFFDLVDGRMAFFPVGAPLRDILSAMQDKGWRRLEPGDRTVDGAGAALTDTALTDTALTDTAGAMPTGDAFWAAGGLVLQSPDARLFDVQRTRQPDARIVLLTDITAAVLERRRADRADSRLADSLDMVSDGLLIFDSDDRLVLMNDRFRQIAEPPDAIVLGMTFEALVRVFVAERRYNLVANSTAKDIEVLVQQRLEFHRSAPSVHERRFYNGRSVLLTTRTTAEGGRVITYNDITDRKNQEEELRQAKEQTERATESLRESQSSMIELTKLASVAGLVAGISHELNTPVGIALTAVSLMSEKQAAFKAKLESSGLKRSDLANYVTSIGDAVRLTDSNLRRAAELIRSFKQVTVDQTSAERRSFDLESYLEEIIISLTPKLNQSQHMVLVSCPAGVRLDSYPGPFAQVMTNLIMNSLLHGFDDGRVGTISINVENRGAAMARIIYRDDGKGMSEQVRRHMFEAFFTTKRDQGGSGLGMSIVHNLITQTLGGDVVVDSAPGRGTCFTIDLPLSPPIPAVAQQSVFRGP